MTRPIPQRIPLQSPIKQLRVEHGIIGCAYVWKIWLTANGDFTLGTFIQLDYNGDINRVTWHENGTETIFPIQQPSGSDRECPECEGVGIITDGWGTGPTCTVCKGTGKQPSVSDREESDE